MPPSVLLVLKNLKRYVNVRLVFHRFFNLGLVEIYSQPMIIVFFQGPPKAHRRTRRAELVRSTHRREKARVMTIVSVYINKKIPPLWYHCQSGVINACHTQIRIDIGTEYPGRSLIQKPAKFAIFIRKCVAKKNIQSFPSDILTQFPRLLSGEPYVMLVRIFLPSSQLVFGGLIASVNNSAA